jgi:hypothetical protein
MRVTCRHSRWGQRSTAAIAVGIAIVVGLVGSCAAPTGSIPAVAGRYAQVPAVPFPPAGSFTVAPDVLDQLACDACAATGAAPLGSARFFYGRLPLAATDALLRGPGTGAPAQLGNLFVSGYFGGLYLRANMATIGGGSAPSSAAPLTGPTPQQAIRDYIGGATYGALDGVVAGLLATANGGSDGEVRSASLVLSQLLALIYGYNRGYLEVAIENPPAGTDPVPAPLSCPSFFDCRVDSLPLGSLDDLAPTLGRLVTPPGATWRWLAASLSSTGEASVAGGRAVWSRLLTGSGFDPAGYTAIIELSYGFLEVTEAALLAVTEGAAGDAAVGRHGLVAAAGLLLWAGSYFLGLASTQPTDVLPTLDCGAA